jgi:hypothetical protein
MKKIMTILTASVVFFSSDAMVYRSLDKPMFVDESSWGNWSLRGLEKRYPPECQEKAASIWSSAGAEPDKKKAFDLFKESLELFPLFRIWDLLAMILSGDWRTSGVDNPVEESFSLLRHHSEKNIEIAYDFGMLLLSGIGERHTTNGQDYKRYDLFMVNQTVENGSEGLNFLRKVLDMSEDSYCGVMAMYEIASWKNKTTDHVPWIVQATAHKYPDFALQLGVNFMNGQLTMRADKTVSITQNKQYGMELLRFAAGKDANYALSAGILLYTGKLGDMTVAKDEEEGLGLLQSACRNDDCAWKLGILYTVGILSDGEQTLQFPQNEKEGKELLLRVATRDPKKAEKLGNAFLSGYMSDPLDSPDFVIKEIAFPKDEAAGRRLLRKK